MSMGKLERFAQMARRELHKQVKARLDVVMQPQSLERREQPATVRLLDHEIAETSRDKVVARVAYTWFNRFCALRFMDVNGYNRVRVVSPSEGFIQPELLTEAKQGMLPEEWFTENPPALERVRGLLEVRIPSQSPEQEAYALLMVAACNSLHKAMPYLFEAINDVTELLLPADLLSPNAVLTYVRDTLDTESCESVEVIGWLYQFYISEIKDKVMGAKAAVAQDDIPAVTQLFTPRWIVGYLVENSLGRLWLQNRPQSKLRGAMKYYLEEPVDSGELVVDREQQLQVDCGGTINSQLSTIHYPNYPLLSSPKDIRLMDPACGSGHILVYAFDLLVEIYREEGFEDHEIAGLILEHNLVGLDIDERAAELASFALTMKARSLSRRFLTNPVQPKVWALSAPGLKTSELEDYQKRVGKDLFSPGILSTLKQWEDAPHFGALIRPKAGDVEALRQKLSNLPIQEDLVLAPTHAKILKALEQIALVGAKVHCVVANPPYMGSGKMNGALKDFVKKEYPNAKADLMTCFMERALEMCVPEGRMAMINLPSWMFLSSFEDMRKSLLERAHFESLVQNGRGIFGSDFGSVSFVLRNSKHTQAKGSYRRLFVEHVQVDSLEEKEVKFLDKEYGWHTARQSDFAKIPGSPIAYWVSEKILNAFSHSSIGEIAESAGRCKTHDDASFVRMVWEVQASEKWKLYNKGGDFRKWYGNYLFVVDWSEESRKIYDSHGGLSNQKVWSRWGVTWSDITAGTNSFRLKRIDSENASASPTLVVDDVNDALSLLSILNSRVVGKLIPIINPTIHLNVGDVCKFPLVAAQKMGDLERPVVIEKFDWDSFETSWDFPGHPLLSQGQWSIQPNGRLRLPGETDAENPNSIDLSVQWPALKSATLAESFAAWRSFAEQQTAELKRLEEENNRLFIDAYGLQGELTPEVPLKEITLTVNPVYRFGEGKSADDYDKLCREAAAKELISYAVGCLFGRYSLDSPGLILANAGETLEDFHAKVPGARFLPDSDNVIPLLEEDWFEDDLYARLKEWLKVAWGPTTLEQNLSWLEEALGNKEQPKALRKYLARDFYKDHVSTYRKRPIYWLFQSPAGSFQALVYLHRYTADTVGVVLNDYVRQFVAKLEGHRKMLLDQSIDPNATQGQKTKALKELDRVRKQLEDLNDYDRDILFPLASQRIALDLDDGVRVNYPKLGAALKRIPGLEGEE